MLGFKIKITQDNIFKTFDFSVLYAKSTQGLNFSNNTIIRTNDLTPQSENKKMFYFNACSNVEISGLKLQGEILGRNIKMDNMPKTNLKLTGKEKLTIE